jgi:UDP-N-acetylmuramate--alanine ligase
MDCRGAGSFRGVDRRFQVKGVGARGDGGRRLRAPSDGDSGDAAGGAGCGYGRVHVLFQPHRYTRTRDLQPEFARAFVDADTVQVLDIYAASEEPIPGVDAAGAGGGDPQRGLAAVCGVDGRERGVRGVDGCGRGGAGTVGRARAT